MVSKGPPRIAKSEGDEAMQHTLSSQATASLGPMSLEQLHVQALMLSKVALQGLNQERTINVLTQVLSHVGGVLSYGVACEPVDAWQLDQPPPGLLRLLHSLAQQCCPAVVYTKCAICCGNCHELQSYLRKQGGRRAHILPLVESMLGVTLWKPLNRGSIVQGEISMGSDPLTDRPVYGQSLSLRPWHACLVEEPACCSLGAAFELELGVCVLCWLRTCLASRRFSNCVQQVSQVGNQVSAKACRTMCHRGGSMPTLRPK